MHFCHPVVNDVILNFDLWGKWRYFSIVSVAFLYRVHGFSLSCLWLFSIVSVAFSDGFKGSFMLVKVTWMETVTPCLPLADSGIVGAANPFSYRYGGVSRTCLMLWNEQDRIPATERQWWSVDLSCMPERRATQTAAWIEGYGCLSETWLDSSVTDAEVSVPCYATYRRDRGSRGGGALVYVTDKCCSRRRNDLEEDGVKILWVEVRMNQKTLLLGNIYWPPNATSSVLDSVELTLERTVSEWKEVILINGWL